VINNGLMAEIDDVLFCCGAKYLHPGGEPKTEEMIKKSGISFESLVLDFGSGRGQSSIKIAQSTGATVIGLEKSPELRKLAQKAVKKAGLQESIQFQATESIPFGFPDNHFDVIFIECVLVLVEKSQFIKELKRVLKPGGIIADLEMTWHPGKALDSSHVAMDEAKQELLESWAGFDTLEIQHWNNLFKDLELSVVEERDFTYTLKNFKKQFMNELGFGGMLKLGFSLLFKKHFRKSFFLYSSLFRQYSHLFGYAYWILKKD
jgi:ubiquinone/menaquinone biosynthesis C-methylase UbiE